MSTPLGLSPATSFAIPAGFLAWNWAFAYVALSSRPWKQSVGIDHNGSPRQDLTKYAEAAIREGKMTRAQLDRIYRIEAASANSTDGFAFFATSGESSFLHPFSRLQETRIMEYLLTIVTSMQQSSSL
ncbi:hypothetical protein H2204_000028 [Knufia peltigerae]|uniref:Uncharacterized protein n=1 Tax=Knufia peltigerae TaxID=1002370 RepID=A0AA38YF49_9EURO|nr:hypothetical protein H2204_000028 [Knufia peltigerae]